MYLYQARVTKSLCTSYISLLARDLSLLLDVKRASLTERMLTPSGLNSQISRQQTVATNALWCACESGTENGNTRRIVGCFSDMMMAMPYAATVE